MDPDKVLASVGPELYDSLARQLIAINQSYMEALARLYQVNIQTVYIWHICGKV